MRYFLALVPDSRFDNKPNRGYDRIYLQAKDEQDARRRVARKCGQGKCPHGTIIY